MAGLALLKLPAATAVDMLGEPGTVSFTEGGLDLGQSGVHLGLDGLLRGSGQVYSLTQKPKRDCL